MVLMKLFLMLKPYLAGHPIICDISGGRDSTNIASALVALDRVKDVSFHTTKPNAKWGLKDLEITMLV